MNRYQWASVAAGAVALGSLGAWFVGRDSLVPTPAETVSTRPGQALSSQPLAGPPAIEEAELADFAAAIEQLVNGAVERVIAQGSGATAAQPGSLRASVGRRVPDGEPLEREFGVTTPGQTGTVEALGLAFTRPWPARYEMALSLRGFSHTANLTAEGAVLYNFIRDDREATAASDGLFRARLALSGDFTGDVDLHGEMAAGKIVALVVLTGGSRARFTFGGREPRQVVTWVTTVAGTGSPGNADGGRNVGELDEPAGVFVDRSGRVFVADTGNHAVRELSPSGELTTLATAFEEPWDLGLDGLGLLVVSDRASRSNDGQGPISRVVTGGELKGLTIRTVAKVGQSEDGLPYCTDFSCDGRSPLAHVVYAGGIEVEGGMVTVAQLSLPSGLKVVTPDGTALTLRGWSQGGCTPAIPGAPHDVVRGGRGELYFTTDCHAVWVLRTDGTVEPLAGTPTTELGFADGIGPDAQFAYPAGLVSDGEYLYLTESNGSLLRRVEIATGATLRIAGCLDDTPGFDCTIPVGFRDGPGDYAQFHNPENLALDPWGDLYVADTENHAIRFVRLANDPERRPVVTQFQPLALQQGVEATLTVRGRDLGLARTVELGAGIAAEVVERSAKRIKVRVRVAEDAPTGAHALTVTTPFGNAAAPDGIALNVIGERASRAQVRTIAGTDDETAGLQSILPAEASQFGFPGGIAAIDRERILVADPMEHRIKLIATKQGAAREFLELAVYEGGGQLGLTILQGIEGFEKLAGDVLGVFGADNFTSAPREEILRAIERSLDAICDAAGSDCEYLSLPWAGVMAAPGDAGGFRLGARLALPTDVAVVGDQQFLIADTANRSVKTVGIDFSGTEPKPAPYQVASADYLQNYVLSVVSTAADTAVAATPTEATLAKFTLRDGSSVISAFAGVRGDFRCERRDGDVRHPLGVAMGMASGKSGTFIADPHCATIWKLDANGEVEDIRGALLLDTPDALPKCADGPLVFATFEKPMDVALDSAGNLWVADSGCHSIRVIKPFGAGDVRALLDQWAGGITGWFDTESAAKVAALASRADLGQYDAARMWVTTVAGSADGEAGFRDGAASEALFNAPVSIAVAEEDGKTYIFVSDVGNKRIRLIDLSARVEATSRAPPPADNAPLADRGVADEGPADERGDDALVAADLDPYNEGIVHASEGRWQEAAEAFARAIALDPQDIDAFVQLGSARLQLEQHSDAVEIYRSALEIGALDQEAHAGLVAALDGLGRYEEMAVAANAWADIAPENALAHLSLAVASAWLENYETAATAFERALVLDANNADAYYSLGVVELVLERYESAAERFRTMTELDPKASGAYTALGVAHRALGEHADALEALQQAIRLRPDSPEARFNLGVVYLETGRRAEALQELATLRPLDGRLASQLEQRLAATQQ
jgi:tetratricopeptide (TPR) repeat protein